MGNLCIIGVFRLNAHISLGHPTYVTKNINHTARAEIDNCIGIAIAHVNRGCPLRLFTDSDFSVLVNLGARRRNVDTCLIYQVTN